MNRPSVVVITTSFPILGDGSEAAGGFVFDLVVEMAQHVDVRVVAPGPVAECSILQQGVEIIRFPAPDKALSNIRIWNPLDAVATLRVLQAGDRAVRQALESGAVRHVFALWALPCGWWAWRASRKEGIAYSVWALGSDIWHLGRLPVVRQVLRFVLRNAKRCFADGINLAADVKKISDRKVEFLPSTRKIERRRTELLRNAPPYRLLFLGRWHPNKGIDLLLEALQLLSGQDWSRIESVTICGGGPMCSIVERGTAILKRSGRPVTVRGFIDKAAAESAILEADYLLLPSRVESIPVVFSDAVKLKCPVLATPVGDLPRLYSGQNPPGLIAQDVTPEAYASLLSLALGYCPLSFEEGLSEISGVFDLGSIVRRLREVAEV